MQQITYAGARFVTGTEIAKALVSYAAALARHGRADSVDIPVRHEDDGQLGIVSFLVGPASQLVTEEVHFDHGEEIHDDELVARLHTLTAELAPVRPSITDSAEREESVDYDWTDEV